MKKILIIVGTRPEAIKLAPVYVELRKVFEVLLISTGQHREMLDQIFNFFEIAPDVNLRLMLSNQTLAQITSLLFTELSPVFERTNPDLIIVQGDTTSAMVAAMVAYYQKIPVAHIEAGLRSHRIEAPFPEEVNRRVISQISQYHFAPTEKAAENLLGFANVHMVGNTIVDSLQMAIRKMAGRDYTALFPNLGEKQGKLVLVTAHRRESFGNGILNICQALEILAKKYCDLDFIFPVHLNPNVKEQVHSKLGEISNICLMPPVNYDEMIYLMMRSRIIMTDSGGLQEEAPTFGVPLVVMREATERTEGVDAGCALLAGIEIDGIVSAFEQIHLDEAKYQSMKSVTNPYGDGQSSLRVSAIIQQFLK